MGNKLGWMIAGGLVLVLAGIGAVWFWPASPTAPTKATTAPGRLDRIEQPESIWQVAPRPSGSGIAADDYNKGVVEYGNTDRYSELRKLSPEQKLAIPYNRFPYRAYKFMLAGSKKRRMRYFAEYVAPASAVRPSFSELVRAAEASDPPLPHLTAFEAMADATLLYGQICQKNGKHKEAERLYQTTLIFGRHIAEDRVRLWSFKLGLKIQIQAAQRLAALYEVRKQQDRLEAASRLLDDLSRTADRVDAKAGEAVFKLSKRGHLHAGDLLNIATNDADPMWRVEAVRQLGLCRASLSRGGNRADHKAITELLTRYQGDEDPFIRAAAELALSMTIEDVRSAR